jgi:hypothetical protein
MPKLKVSQQQQLSAAVSSSPAATTAVTASKEVLTCTADLCSVAEGGPRQQQHKQKYMLWM